nr:MAG: late control gene D protein [Bacteriophage sp.]
MGQTTSALWHDLLHKPGTEREYKFIINNVEYGKDAEVSHSVESQLFEEFGIGNACCATLKLAVIADNIPRAATIKRYLRLVNGTQATAWIPKGVFFTNKRSRDDDYWEVEAYDAMRKADVVWEPSNSLTFPMSMPTAVNLFCQMMGVNLDKRTVLNSAYTIDYPANDYTVRNELCFIAAAHGGNWIMTDAGKLLLIPLLSMPTETNYLITEAGNAITFGGVRILV